MKIGIISDTHGVINPKVYDIFEGVSQILHAGDIGNVDIITSLETRAPVKAITGNTDSQPLVARYPEVLALELAQVSIVMVHIFTNLRQDNIQKAVRTLPRQSLDLVIYGHSHQASLAREGDVLLLNPGSAGRKRFSLRPAVALLRIPEEGKFTPEIVYLD